MRSKKSIYLTLTAVLAALYAVGVVFLAPISFQLFQVRIADALLPLAILFGWPAIIGLSIGAFVANFFGGLGPVDILGGALANFIATFVAWKVANNRGRSRVLLGVTLEILAVTLVVGTYLSFLFGMPIQVGWLGVLLGSVVAIGILGSTLLFALSSRRMTAMLRSYGLAQEKNTVKG
jgi:uncharacterized membrane protein